MNQDSGIKIQESSLRLTWAEDISGSLQGAGGIGGLLATTNNQQQRTTNFFHFDSHGNVICLSDTTAKESARYQYDAFGKTMVAQGVSAAANRYQFSTKPIDGGASLAFYGFRYYSIGLGRWMSKDVIHEFGGINLVAFVLNSPLGLVDVVGKSPVAGSTGIEVPGSADPTYDCGGHATDLERPVTTQSVVENNWATDCDTSYPCQCGYHRVAIYNLVNGSGSIPGSVHLYREEEDGTWSCKYGLGSVYNGITDPTADFNAVYTPLFTTGFQSWLDSTFGTSLNPTGSTHECYCVPDL